MSKRRARDEQMRKLPLTKGISKSVQKDSDILWNFTKFLINRDGTVVKRFAPVADPKSFEKDIEEML